MRNQNSKLFKHLILLLLLFNGLYAGITGTISGEILDEVTSQPLEGVQVVLLGTSKGAITNSKGEFIVVNLQPGSYDLQFQFIGYTLHVQTNVAVLVDIQTRLHIQLKPSVIEGERAI